MRKAVLSLRFAILAAVAFSLSGCLSHWFLDSSSRLQVENATEDCSIISLDVASEDSTQFVPWVSETLLPGERSRVSEEDWVGEFSVRIMYTKSADASGDTLTEIQQFEFDGGSFFLKIGGDRDSLTYKILN